MRPLDPSRRSAGVLEEVGTGQTERSNPSVLVRPDARLGDSWAETLAKLSTGKVGAASPLFERGQGLEKNRTARLLDYFETPTADWARLEVASAAAMELIRRSPARATRVELMTAIYRRLVEHGLEDVSPLRGASVEYLIDQLVRLGTLGRGTRGRWLYTITAPPEEVAFKLSDVGYFKDRLTDALTALRLDEPDAKLQLISLISKSAREAEGWPRYPVESRWPFLKAVALLSAEDQHRLVGALDALPQLRSYPLIDSTLLMLKGETPETWVQDFAPRLAGSCVYTVAAEGWHAAGGLGRVQQYHAAAMKKLVGEHARVATIEPFYRETARGKAIDYSDLPTPVQDRAKIEEFEVRVGGQNVKAEVFRGTNEYGIEVYLIRDVDQRLTRGCYAYDQNGTGSWQDFTEFFSRASLELVRRLEAKEKAARGAAYRPPAIIANDGQVAPLVPFFREAEKKDPQLDGAAVWMVTHTYRNRGIFDGGGGQQLLDRWQIPDELRPDFWRLGQLDVTCAGVRGADGASAVSAIHRDEVAHIDPWSEIIAITNGDNRRASSARFRELLGAADPAGDPERPTPKALVKAKGAAKAALGLDPEQVVISYSGRLVGEKAGMERAFTEKNIRDLVAKGAQVVIYGNVQAPEDSKALGRRLEALAQQLDEERQAHPERGLGRLVFRPEFGLADQIKLLAATDLQVQDSDRGTGAAEYTESDVTANGGLQLGPPWIEGIIQRQGMLLDREHPGVGNTLIPNDRSEGAYFKAMEWVVDQYHADPLQLAQWQSESVPLSRPLDALLTGAEYLRQLDRVLGRLAEKKSGQ